ncbi:MAG: esterase [Deltaproteobacteria bacterium]|nr:esterase [Deltaproteobacteria bacterium]
MTVFVPQGASPEHHLPVLVALHGQGESRKPPSVGARGWIDDYWLARADARLRQPPLSSDDFLGMITPERLAKINRSLRERPFRGLIVVCPYLPDRFRKEAMYTEARLYGEFLVKQVLPRVHREAPALSAPAQTGIDGVSLGGRAGLLAGLGHAEHFGAVAASQPAIGKSQVERVTQLAVLARNRSPGLRLRLLSSQRDRFREVTLMLGASFAERGVDADVDIVEGNHSYELNRGPGAYEMLLWFDRALRGERYL